MSKLPVLDILDVDFDVEFVTALKEIGFAAIINSSGSRALIDPIILENAYRASESFFNSSYKIEHSRPETYGQRGYTQFGVEKAKNQNSPDLKEFIQFGYDNNLSPNPLTDLHYQLFHDLFLSMDALAENLLDEIEKILSIPLRAGSVGVLSERDSVLRAIHYPPTGPNPAGVRSAEHEDINLLTILPAASAAGLQVLNRYNHWIDAPTDSNLLIVNVGDMLQEYTSGVLKSTTHRVLNTIEGEFKSRYSLPFFFHPKASMRLSERYTAGEYLNQRLKEIGLKK